MAASVHVFTFKSGLLSRLAHDLRLRCERFAIEVDGDELRAAFDPASLRVDGVMKKGRLDRGGLSASDYAKIEGTIRDEVLQTSRHRTVELAVRLAGDPVELSGTLSLRGQSRPLPRTRVRRDGADWLAEVELVPSRWGVAPYRALGGALKLEDRVQVQVRVPADADADARKAKWVGPAGEPTAS